MSPRRINWTRELVLCAVLVGAGALALPPAVYLVGQQVVGEYGDNSGMLDLAIAIWRDLVGMRATAWMLVLSPYAVIVLLRLARARWKARGRSAGRP